MLISNELQNEPGNCEDSEMLMNHFRTDMGLIFKQSISTIAKSFDDCFFGISELSSTNKTLYNYKMREVDALFDTIVTSFYKNKVLTMIPDLVFTLEANRFSKAAIISQNLLNLKHKSYLKKGLDAFRRNVSRFYIKQNKLEEQFKCQTQAIKWISKFTQRKEQLQVINGYNTIKNYALEKRDDLRQKDYQLQSDNQLKAAEVLKVNLRLKDELIHKAQKCYQIISNFANTNSENIEQPDYQQILTEM